MLNIYIDASPLVDPRPSGIGHLIAATAASLSKKLESRTDMRLVLLVPQKNTERLDRWPELKDIKRKKFPFRTRILNGLIRYNLLPWMDIFFGRGVYIFGNFKNWPLTRFSRSLTYIHDISFILHPNFAEPRNLSLLSKKLPRFIARTNRIITISESSKNEIMGYYKLSQSDLDVVHCGVDSELYKKYPQSDVLLMRKKYGLSKQYLIYVGNIEPRKNLKILVQALENLPAELMAKTDLLIIGGNGWQNQPILNAIRVAQKSGVSIIQPKTYVEDRDVAILISGALALVQPSLHEGFSIPPVEALATRTRVMASDIPVHKEILGSSATYFDPTSIGDITSKITQALQRTKITKDIDPKIFTDKYSWDKAADQLLKIIVSLPEKKVKIASISKEI